jgi:hypothetical protein
VNFPDPPEGDDDALILWMLSLTPTQRLEVAQGFVDSVQALRSGRLGADPTGLDGSSEAAPSAPSDKVE